MKNIKYRVDRDNVHIGTIVKASYIDKIDEDVARLKYLPEDILIPQNYRIIRPSVLFVPDENDRMNDLLYDTPAYKVLNITDPKEISAREIIVSDACNLSPLLAHLGYGKELTYGDIFKIRKVIFSPEFYANFCELFGFRETYASEIDFYEDGKKLEDLEKLAQKMRKFEDRKLAGELGFDGVTDAPLNPMLFDAIHEHADEVSLYNPFPGFKVTRIKDAFAPGKEEKGVKKLSLTN